MHIRCHVCSNKPVGKISVSADPARNVRVIKVWCHGQTDSMEIPHDFLVDPEMNAFVTRVHKGEQVGIAFRPQYLWDLELEALLAQDRAMAAIRRAQQRSNAEAWA